MNIFRKELSAIVFYFNPFPFLSVDQEGFENTGGRLKAVSGNGER